MSGHPPIRALRIAGSPAALGVRHGTAHRERIHAFLEDGLCRLNHLLISPTSRDRLAATIDRHGEVIARELPRTFEEIAGLANGAGIDLRDALLLQLRREVLGYTPWPAGGDCTTLGRAGPGGALLGQTIDLNGALDDHLAVLAVDHAGRGHRVLLVTFTGLLGYLGLNSAGLAVGINLVLGGTWSPGVPPYLAVRHLLDECSDVESCLDRLRSMRLASSRSLMLCDRRQVAWVELVAGQLAALRGKELAHTNHFLAPEFAARDAINPFARAASRRRLDACRGALSGLGERAAPEAVMDVFTRAPIRVPDTGDIRRERTVGAVVLRPGPGELHVRRGDPALTTTEVFHVHDASEPAPAHQGFT